MFAGQKLLRYLIGAVMILIAWYLQLPMAVVVMILIAWYLQLPMAVVVMILIAWYLQLPMQPVPITTKL